MRIVATSDTHSRIAGFNFPDGDVLIHCGDHTMLGQAQAVKDSFEFIAALPHRHKIVIAGNHDFALEGPLAHWARETSPSLHYLENEAIEIGGLKFYGCPYTPQNGEWAFMYGRNGDRAKEIWGKIPEDVNVLITHGPPKGHLDSVGPWSVGCEVLAEQLPRLKDLKLHVFGHIHEDFGFMETPQALFYNVSALDEHYKNKRGPVVIELDLD